MSGSLSRILARARTCSRLPSSGWNRATLRGLASSFFAVTLIPIDAAPAQWIADGIGLSTGPPTLSPVQAHPAGSPEASGRSQRPAFHETGAASLVPEEES
jgi:hypothetical protein